MAGEPETVATALWLGGGVGAALAAFWQGRKGKADAQPKGEATVLTASIADPRMFQQLGASIEGFREQQHEDSRRLREAIEDMTRALKLNTDAQGQGAVTPHDMMALIARLGVEK